MYSWVREAFSAENIFIVADETSDKQYSWNSDYNVIAMNESFMDRNYLFSPGADVGWRCGDYCYLAVSEAVDFDFIWLIEPDVAANFKFDFLLSGVGDNDADLIGSSLRLRSSTWPWFKSMAELGHAEVHSVFFPLTRVSRELVGMIRDQRVEMSMSFRSGNQGLYPNDEAVTATTAIEGGFSTLNLQDVFSDMFSHFRWGVKWLYPDVFENFDQPKMVHPAVDGSDYARYLRKLISESSSNRGLLDSLGASLWSVSAANYYRWRGFVLSETGRWLDKSVFDR
ncbi:hypothetical protein [Brevibacterium linens]|uniref:hypothetical protein n=1 Tax=Brevibacterium linens TaxID=1703 RepID=UPI000FCA7782|nr:hypothetical protein [Brevibacterium linens]